MPTFDPTSGVVDDTISPSAFLRADTLAVTDGTAVSTIADTSGGVAWTQATGTKQPLFKTNIFGSKPALRFDGVDDMLARTAGAAYNFSTVFILFRVLVAITTSTASKSIMGWNGPAGGESFGIDFGNNTGGLTNELVTVQYIQANRSAYTLAASTFATATTHMLGTRWDSGTTRYLIYRDGSANVQNAFTGTPSQANSTITSVGASPNAEWAINADIGVCLVYATVLTDAQKAAVHSWMQDVWGATAADYNSAWAPVKAPPPWDASRPFRHLLVR